MCPQYGQTWYRARAWPNGSTRAWPRGLVLVCAPAGYGKTVLLADWVRRSEHPAAWLSLDAGDNDPARFWRHAVAALDRARPGVSDRMAALLGPPAPSSFQGFVTALINELAAEPDAGEALLVLDDYHVIGAQSVHESLAFLLEHRPAGIRTVLASRSDPPLPLARLRARGQLAELRAAELRFTPDEAAALLRHAGAGSGLALPDASVAALAARAEGWAAGLQLAGLSLRGQQDVAGFVAAFTGSHRYILDYLTEEVLERQSEQVRAFLLETSVLDRLSGELCDAVTGRAGSQVLLEQVEQAGLFLVPLDEVRGWWRYHHLFADLLRARLQQEQPARAAQLHRNAAAWYQRHELADDAIRHATAAADMTWAARLIEQHFDAFFYLRGETATIRRWLSALPADVLRSRPRLLLIEAQLAAAGGRLDVVERSVAAAERAAAATAEEPFEPTIGRGASLLVNIPAHNELDLARRHVTEGIALCRQFVYTAPLAAGLVTLAWIRQASSDPAGALEAIGEAEQVAPGPAGLLNPVPAQRARLLLAQGDLAAAARWIADNGLAAGDEPHYPGEPGYLVLARVLLAQHRSGEAAELLDRLRAAAAIQGRSGSLIEIDALRALGLAAVGDEDAAVFALTGALALAGPQGYIRVFADEGRAMAVLLGKLIAAQRTEQSAARVSLGYLARLQRAFVTERVAQENVVLPAIVEPLTGRELEILRMMAAGRSNQSIAGELVVTLDTVKKHVGHVLRKLGAANRTEAVARARELSLIP
jgi:ATP/maltotriose-dependent transcriptional regulator MalT